MSEYRPPYEIGWGIKAGKESAKLLFKALSRARKRPEYILPYVDSEAARESLTASFMEMHIVSNLRFIRGEAEEPAAYIDFIKAFALSRKKQLQLELPEWTPPVAEG